MKIIDMETGREGREVSGRLMEFITGCPDSYHTAAAVRRRLEQAGFTALDEKEEYRIRWGGKYYVNRNGSSLIAFALPAQPCARFLITASHSDSPAFKIKEHPQISVEDHYTKWNTEPYGSMIYSTWMDRPLSVAGRVMVRDGSGIGQRLIHVDRDLCVIPNLSIHMNREINKGVEHNPQIDLLPLCGGMEDKDSFLQLIADEAGVGREDVLSHDLFLYNRDQGRFFGMNQEFILSPRLDDLQCAYACLEGLLQAGTGGNCAVYALYDNEEVGSRTKQGADSTLLSDTLARLTGALGLTEEEKIRMTAGSFMLSADNAHGVHPNHPEKADLTNKPYLNGGIVIKYHAGQRYTTDAWSAAAVKEVCRKAGVPYQTYFNRSDIPGGSTLGNFSASHVAVDTADIGLAQLAMHSACETAGALDTAYLIRAIRSFYEG